MYFFILASAEAVFWWYILCIYSIQDKQVSPFACANMHAYITCCTHTNTQIYFFLCTYTYIGGDQQRDSRCYPGVLHLLVGLPEVFHLILLIQLTFFGLWLLSLQCCWPEYPSFQFCLVETSVQPLKSMQGSRFPSGVRKVCFKFDHGYISLKTWTNNVLWNRVEN